MSQGGNGEKGQHLARQMACSGRYGGCWLRKARLSRKPEAREKGIQRKGFAAMPLRDASRERRGQRHNLWGRWPLKMILFGGLCGALHRGVTV